MFGLTALLLTTVLFIKVCPTWAGHLDLYLSLMDPNPSRSPLSPSSLDSTSSTSISAPGNVSPTEKLTTTKPPHLSNSVNASSNVNQTALSPSGETPINGTVSTTSSAEGNAISAISPSTPNSTLSPASTTTNSTLPGLITNSTTPAVLVNETSSVPQTSTTMIPAVNATTPENVTSQPMNVTTAGTTSATTSPSSSTNPPASLPSTGPTSPRPPGAPGSSPPSQTLPPLISPVFPSLTSTAGPISPLPTSIPVSPSTNGSLPPPSLTLPPLIPPVFPSASSTRPTLTTRPTSPTPTSLPTSPLTTSADTVTTGSSGNATSTTTLRPPGNCTLGVDILHTLLNKTTTDSGSFAVENSVGVAGNRQDVLNALSKYMSNYTQQEIEACLDLYMTPNERPVGQPSSSADSHLDYVRPSYFGAVPNIPVPKPPTSNFEYGHGYTTYLDPFNIAKKVPGYRPNPYLLANSFQDLFVTAYQEFMQGWNLMFQYGQPAYWFGQN